ncbi:MAG: hypothetical protein V4760_05340 [Bdellovibrionota bacterium]
MDTNRDIKTGYDNSGGQTGLSAEEANSPDIPVPLHPETALNSAAAKAVDPVSAIETFARRLATSLDSDYGDWMREANVAWIELADALGSDSPEIEAKLERLHDLIQYRPNWRPIETCRAALILARDLRRTLGVPGDLDLHRYGIGWTEAETSEVELEEASPYPNHRMPTDRTYDNA